MSPSQTPLAAQRHQATGQGTCAHTGAGDGTVCGSQPQLPCQCCCLWWVSVVQNCLWPESPCLKPVHRQEALHCSTAETHCSGKQQDRSPRAGCPSGAPCVWGLSCVHDLYGPSQGDHGSFFGQQPQMCQAAHWRAGSAVATSPPSSQMHCKNGWCLGADLTSSPAPWLGSALGGLHSVGLWMLNLM